MHPAGSTARADTGAPRRQEDESHVSDSVVQGGRVPVDTSVYAAAPLTVAPTYAASGSTYEDTPLTQATLSAPRAGGASSFYAEAPLTQPTPGSGSTNSFYAEEPLTRAPAEVGEADGGGSVGYEIPLDDDAAVDYSEAADCATPSGPQVRVRLP